MSEATQHPEILRFAKALDARGVDRFKAEAFNRFRLGPKCSDDPELKAAADALWQRLEAMGGPQDPIPSATVAPRRETRRSGGSASGTRSRDTPPADAEVLGSPFHNPYTFLPFGNAPKRHAPTPISADEKDPTRFTGIIELDLVTLSPLLSCSPVPADPDADHKRYSALCIGNDVIVPASGIRGALRNLMTILTGGPLSYVDEEAWLCQGRDLPLGPAGGKSPASTPRKVFLAEVVRPGSYTRSGSLRLGETKLVPANALEQASRSSLNKPLPRPKAGRRIQHLYSNASGTELTGKADKDHQWRVKLSGRPIMRKGKREGLFLPGDEVVDAPWHLWAAYQGRNAHGDHPELRKDDLVWLEAKQDRTSITSSDDIASLQWARWGRRGERLLDVVIHRHPQMIPDSINPYGHVDEVTDLFGQVPREDLVREAYPDWEKSVPGQPGPAGPFAARVRPENLVFHGAAKDGLARSVPLAPLAPPHPGCAAFYRDQDDPMLVANGRTGLRGYKVYRTSRERGDAGPWHFAQQAVYDVRGRPQNAKQKVNKTVDLVEAGCTGSLRIACRSLSRRELALLMAACSIDWRLGGGKPLGLGHCRITGLRLLNEDGQVVTEMARGDSSVAAVPSPYAEEIDQTLSQRLRMWQASQEPVGFLRYPRAVIENRNRKSRGGHVWFARHANPRKVLDRSDGLPAGLEFVNVGGELAAKAESDRISPQVLPRFDPDQPDLDVLYGHDLFIGEGTEWSEKARNRQTIVKKVEPFDPDRHSRDSDHSGGSQGQTQESRRQEREQR